MSPSLPRQQTVPISGSQGQAGVAHGLAVLLISFFAFCLVARLPEFLLDIFHINFRLVLGLALLCSLAGLVDSALPRVFPSRVAVVFTGLFLWVVAAVPFAIWKGGSFSVMVSFWFLSVASFYLVAGAPVSLRDCEKIMRALGWGVILLLLASFRYAQFSEGRASFALASLANPNLYAMQIIYGLPFCGLLFRRLPKLLAHLLTAAVVLYALSNLIKTASRSALISVVVMALVLMLTSSLRTKVASLAVVIFAIVYVFTSSSNIAGRYRTVLGMGSAFDTNSVSAQESSNLRRKLLFQSLLITAENPLFGVGPGNFPIATADLKRDDASVAAWLASHNTPTQLSSEAGIPSLLLFLWAWGASLWIALKNYLRFRKNRAQALAAELSYALLLSLVGISVTALFANIAYQFYFPVLFGLAVALQRNVDREQALVLNAGVAPAYVPAGPMGPFSQAPKPLPSGPPPNPNRLRRPPRYWVSSSGSKNPIHKS